MDELMDGLQVHIWSESWLFDIISIFIISFSFFLARGTAWGILVPQPVEF